MAGSRAVDLVRPAAVTMAFPLSLDRSPSPALPAQLLKGGQISYQKVTRC